MPPVLTVTLLNTLIKELLEAGFAQVWVEGEISNLRAPLSGHRYFTLKDDASQIRAVVFRSAFPRRGGGAFELEDGMTVVCRGRLSVYQPRGEYQLIVEAVEPKGVGALQKAFEQLKARLAAEGLFAAAAKRPLPFLPGRIGVVTSPTGAVIRDILTVTARRCPGVDVLIAPARVQGAGAAAELVAALRCLEAAGGVDVVILARGGGSLEDLAPFNDEGLARAIRACRIPVISAVGHETDFTIADFAADVRAATPSAAAEMAVPVRRELAAAVARLNLQLAAGMQRVADGLRERVAGAQGRLAAPGRRIADLRLSIDDRCERLHAAGLSCLGGRRQSLNHAAALLARCSPRAAARQHRHRLRLAEQGLAAAWKRGASRLRERLAADAALLDTLSPLSVLRRGYSIARSLATGVILRRSAETAAGEGVTVRLGEGGFHARVTEVFAEEAYGQGEI
jgi:exodeoxyribonuclease VII large subunit